MAHRIHPPIKMYHELKFVHLEALRQPTKILTGDGYNQTARFNGILGDITIMFVPMRNDHNVSQQCRLTSAFGTIQDNCLHLDFKIKETQTVRDFGAICLSWSGAFDERELQLLFIDTAVSITFSSHFR